MATATTLNPADFANRIQTYFNPKLMDAIVLNLVLAQFGMKKSFPARGQTIRFFRPRKANRTGVQTLVEGVTPTTKTEVAVGYVDVPLTQKGGIGEITDVVEAIDLLDTVRLYTSTMGEDAALDFDAVIRDALINGALNSNATYTYGAGSLTGYFERFAGVDPTGNSANDFASLQGLSNANGKMTRARHLAMVTQLKTAGVPKINGLYSAVISPAVTHDIRQDTDWVGAAIRNNGARALYKNEVIELDGAVFIEHDNAFIEDEVYGTFDAADGDSDGLVFSSIYLGRDAFGIPDLSNKRAGGSGLKPKITVLAGADKADPLNQKTVIGWKSHYGCKALITSESSDVPRYGILRTKSTFK
jgi:N4-gp56 family major capsid protein